MMLNLPEMPSSLWERAFLWIFEIFFPGNHYTQTILLPMKIDIFQIFQIGQGLFRRDGYKFPGHGLMTWNQKKLQVIRIQPFTGNLFSKAPATVFRPQNADIFLASPSESHQTIKYGSLQLCMAGDTIIKSLF